MIDFFYSCLINALIVYHIQWFKSLLNYYSMKYLIGKLQLSIYVLLSVLLVSMKPQRPHLSICCMVSHVEQFPWCNSPCFGRCGRPVS